MSDFHYVRCIVTGNALAISKNKGTASVKIALLSAPKDGEAQRPLYCDLWLTENAVERTIQTLEKALGWTGKSFSELNDPVFVDQEVIAVCGWEEDDQGRPREVVKFLNSPAGGAGVKRAETQDVKAITSKMDGFLKLARANNPLISREPAGY